MGLFNLFGNYDKPGPGVSKDEPPKAAPIRFFEIYWRKFSKLIQLNLIFLIPSIVAAVLMFLLYFSPTHIILQLPAGGSISQLDVWTLYIVPLPLILLSPCVAGLTIVTRNFAREEHAFVWSDFWEAVRNNWKYFLLNGIVIYLVYIIISFSLVYYYNRAFDETMFLVPFWLCIVISVVFLFAQYYIPVMFVTFDLKFGQIYKNALIFILAGFGRNILLTVILGGLVFLIVGVIPIMPLTIFLLLVLLVFFAFSFTAFLINFTIYPIIDQYMIQPYQKQLQEQNSQGGKEPEKPVEEKYSGLFRTDGTEDEEDEEEEDKYVYVNGKLVKASQLKPQEKDELDD